MPVMTARKALTLGGCLFTHVVTTWIGLLGGLILSLSLYLLSVYD